MYAGILARNCHLILQSKTSFCTALYMNSMWPSLSQLILLLVQLQPYWISGFLCLCALYIVEYYKGRALAFLWVLSWFQDFIFSSISLFPDVWFYLANSPALGTCYGHYKLLSAGGQRLPRSPTYSYLSKPGFKLGRSPPQFPCLSTKSCKNPGLGPGLFIPPKRICLSDDTYCTPPDLLKFWWKYYFSAVCTAQGITGPQGNLWVMVHSSTVQGGPEQTCPTSKWWREESRKKRMMSALLLFLGQPSLELCTQSCKLVLHKWSAIVLCITEADELCWYTLRKVTSAE